jgi:hypothetical protein
MLKNILKLILSIFLIIALAVSIFDPFYIAFSFGLCIRIVVEYLILNLLSKIIFKKRLIELITDGFKSV